MSRLNVAYYIKSVKFPSNDGIIKELLSLNKEVTTYSDDETPTKIDVDVLFATAREISENDESDDIKKYIPKENAERLNELTNDEELFIRETVKILYG